ncbi:MAG: acetolactate synthase small subunit [Rickettsiales bacterium]
MTDISRRHVLAILLDNETGALMRVVNLFSARGYNIDSLTVSDVNVEGTLSRITVVTYAPDKVIGHIIHLLERLVPVHRVDDVSSCRHVERGLLLVKIESKGAERAEILHVAGDLGAKLAHVSSDVLILQATDTQENLDRILEAMRQYRVIEVARTGVTAMAADETLRSRDA